MKANLLESERRFSGDFGFEVIFTCILESNRVRIEYRGAVG
jgi:hypothetical protein